MKKIFLPFFVAGILISLSCNDEEVSLKSNCDNKPCHPGTVCYDNKYCMGLNWFDWNVNIIEMRMGNRKLQYKFNGEISEAISANSSCNMGECADDGNVIISPDFENENYLEISYGTKPEFDDEECIEEGEMGNGNYCAIINVQDNRKVDCNYGNDTWCDWNIFQIYPHGGNFNSGSYIRFELEYVEGPHGF